MAKENTQVERDYELEKFTIPRLVSYKLVESHTVYDLEAKVNHFLQQPGNDFYACIGVPQMFGHSSYVQALQGYR